LVRDNNQLAFGGDLDSLISLLRAVTHLYLTCALPVSLPVMVSRQKRSRCTRFLRLWVEQNVDIYCFVNNVTQIILSPLECQ